MADSNHLKRPFAQVAGQRPSHPHAVTDAPCELHASMSVQTLEESNNLPRFANKPKRISRSLSRPDFRCQSDLHSLSPSFPSFMSALGPHKQRSRNGERRRDASLGTKSIANPETSSRAVTTVRTRARIGSDSTRLAASPAVTKHASSTPSYPDGIPRRTQSEYSSGPAHFPRESGSLASESTDSSPTTTSSTFDSPLVIDASPSSSPESPSSVTPLPSVKQTIHCMNGDTQARPPPSDSLLHPIQPESPRKGRNLKNLSLKLAPPKHSRPALTTAPVGSQTRNLSAPSSPIYPPSKPSRRRQPNLTIQTPSLESSFSTGVCQVVPPTPGTRPVLRHFESSPSLNSVHSPTSSHFNFSSQHLLPNQQAMGPGTDDSSLPKTSLASGRPSFTPSNPLQALGEEDDCLVSRESSQGNEKGYPNGPILIYDSGLYLYLEPTREEASKFDVIFNVANEVANPFKKDPMQTTVMSVWKATMSDGTPQQNTTRGLDTSRSDTSFKSALDYVPTEDESPTTPRADTTSQPEYIHVPWDHNSEILDDLYPLCEMIDDRISKGKSVLVHCQLGVSRSASLVIAYGLYKNPEMDFNSIYSIVKERSCWVGPNMSLIYQLTDFRSRVRQGGPTKSPPDSWFREKSDSQPQPPKPDETYPSSQPKAMCQEKPQLSNIVSPIALQDSPSLESSSFSCHLPSSRPSTSGGPRRNMLPRPLPLREKYQAMHSLRRPPQIDGASLCQRSITRPSTRPEPVKDDVPPTPSLFSPKGVSGPLSRNSAGDLALPRESMDFSTPSGTAARPPVLGDPRSPQQRREPIIMRNIDEFL